METSQLTQYLVTHGWNEKPAREVVYTGLIDTSLSLQEWQNTFVGAYMTRYKEMSHVLSHLADFLCEPIPLWKHITKSRMVQFKSYIVTKVSKNSAKQYLSTIAAVVHSFSEEDVLPSRNYEGSFTMRSEPSQHIALTEEEIERIHRYQPRTDVESDVKRAFMLECLTGARASDISSLSELKISQGYLTYISQKTKTKTTVPVHHDLMQYLNQKGSGKVHSRSTFNKVIQDICRFCHIDDVTELFCKGKWNQGPKWKFVTSHTARRSFVTMLALRGVPLATISSLAGHSSPVMTGRYVCVNTQNLDANTLAFFR